jgi:enoyl-CoA hydratase
VGRYLALTGARIDGADCFAVGLATHYLPAEALAEAKSRIAEDPERIEGILGQLAVKAPEAKIVDNIPAINRLFASDRFEDVLALLDADESPWAMKELPRSTPNRPRPARFRCANWPKAPRQPLSPTIW